MGMTPHAARQHAWNAMLAQSGRIASLTSIQHLLCHDIYSGSGISWSNTSPTYVPGRLIAEPDRRRFSGSPPEAKITSARCHNP
jgi:hypothetical protein